MRQKAIAPGPILRLGPRGVRKPSNPTLDLKNSLSHGLLGCWLLGDASQGRAHDISPYGNNGALLNFVANSFRGSHHGGLALNFDGSNDSFTVSTATNPFFALTTPFSFSVWLYSATTQANLAGVFAGPNSAGLVGGYEMYATSADNKLNFAIAFPTAASAVAATSNAIIPTGSWFHAVGVWDGAQVALYINGVKQTTTGSASSISYDTLLVNPLTFGSYSQFSTFFWNGGIEGARFYNRALNLSEIQKLYSSPYEGIINYVPFNRKGTSGTNASVNLTGVSGIGSPGAFSVTAGGNASVNLTGVAGTGAPGAFALTNSPNISISGVAGTGSPGAFSPATSALLITVIAPYLSTDTIGTKTYQIYQIVAGVLTAIGSPITTSFVALPNITNGWGVEVSVVANGAYGDFAGLAVFGNINGSDARAVELYSPPTSTPASLDIVKIAPFQPADVIVTPGYQLYNDAWATLGSHMTSGIVAITGVTNGYAAKLSLTPGATNGFQGGVLWDGG